MSKKPHAPTIVKYKGWIIRRFGPLRGPVSQITYEAASMDGSVHIANSAPYKRCVVPDTGADEPWVEAANVDDPCDIHVVNGQIRLVVMESIIMTTC